jgi:choice-of-anchor C domain-containing protein
MILASAARCRTILPTLMLVTLLALSCALAAAPARANLLTNGSFETGPDPGTSVTMSAGPTAVSGWFATRAGARYVSTLWTAASGYRSIALNTTGAGGIAQTFATLPHARYNVRFYLAGDPDSQPLIKTMSVTAGHQRGDFTADITGMWAWDPGWNPHNWSFLAESTFTTIEFFSTMTGTTGATLDSVSLDLVSLAAVGDAPPSHLEFSAPWPNPSHGVARLAFAMPRAADVKLTVLDLAGRVVRVLHDAPLAAGAHELLWDGRAVDRAAPPGLYFAELRVAGERVVRPLVRIE